MNAEACVTDRGRTSFLQIQPRFDRRDEWEELALREDLHYEVLELSVPPALDGAQQTAECRKWYRSGGRVTSVHGAFIDVNPGSSDPSFRRLSFMRCRQSMDLAVELGAENVVFHSSCFPFLRGGYLEMWADSCAAFYEELADAYGLNVFIENSQDLDAAPLCELMRRIENRRVGVCLDLGHVHYSRMSAQAWFDALHDRIGYLHLSDNDGTCDSHLILGEGTVDWKTADRLWRSLGRMVPVTIETDTPEKCAASIAFLKERGYFQSNTRRES